MGRCPGGGARISSPRPVFQLGWSALVACEMPPGEGRYWCSTANMTVADVAMLLNLGPSVCFSPMQHDQCVKNPPDGVTYSLLSCSTDFLLQPFHSTLRLQQHPKFWCAPHPNAVWQTDTFPFLNLIKTAVVMVYSQNFSANSESWQSAQIAYALHSVQFRSSYQ